MIEQVAEAVKEALAGQFKATLHHGVSKAEGFAFNRLYRTTDGDEIFGRESENIIDYAGPADPTVPSHCGKEYGQEDMRDAGQFCLSPGYGRRRKG